MSAAAFSDSRRYEQACDQAIAMCDGNLRSTIKALIMANEYLEIELAELQAAVAAGCVPNIAFSSEVVTGREENASRQETSAHSRSTAA